MNIEELRKLNCLENIRITMHAAKRLEQRGISIDDIISGISTGEIIEEYPSDYPYPSCLILGSAQNKAIHIVASTDTENIWLITAYRPDANSWESDFKTRKEN